MQKIAHHSRHRRLDALDVVDEGGDEGAGGVALKECGGAAEEGVVEVVAKIRDHAEAGFVGEQRTEVVGDGFDDGGSDERDGNDGPRIVEAVRQKDLQINVAMGMRNDEVQDFVR